MKYTTYFSCKDSSWHIKEIDESKIREDRYGRTEIFEYEGGAYGGPLFDSKEDAYQSRELKFTSKQIIED